MPAAVLVQLASVKWGYWWSSDQPCTELVLLTHVARMLMLQEKLFLWSA